MVVMLLVFSVFFVPVQGFLCAAGGLAADLRSAGQEFCGMEVLAGGSASIILSILHHFLKEDLES